MPLYWLVYRHNNQISVVIEPSAERGWPVQRQADGWATAIAKGGKEVVGEVRLKSYGRFCEFVQSFTKRLIISAVPSSAKREND